MLCLLKNPLKHLRFVLFLAFLLMPLSLSASGTMTYFKSESGVFQTYVPETYEIDETPFRIGPKRVVYSSELSASQDQRPYKNTVKTFTIRTEQTFGPSLTEKEKISLIEQDLDLYVDFYKDNGGKVINRSAVTDELGKSAEMILSFEDTKLGTQYMKLRIVMSDVTKLQQILMSASDIMDTFRVKQYFESLSVSNGVTRHDMELVDSWDKHESALGIFTSYLPENVKPYFPSEPQKHNSKKSEVISATFFDPILNQEITYNTYGYKLSRNLSFFDAKDVLNKRHISKQKTVVPKIDIQEINSKGRTLIQTEFPIRRQDRLQYKNYIKLKAEFKGQYMVVHEIIGSKRLVDSAFIQNVMDHTVFHPSVAKALEKNFKAPESP